MENENLANSYCGWASRLPAFTCGSLEEIVASLSAFVADATPEQIRAWRNSVPPVQASASALLNVEPKSVEYGAVLEYLMPDGPRRADVILLVSGAVLVIELKGDDTWQPEFIEQASDYARRLYWYHALCGSQNVRVHTILASYGRRGTETFAEWHTCTNADNLLNVVRRFDRPAEALPIKVSEFIAPQTWQPSLSLVQAARKFFADHELPHIKRIDDITAAAVDRIVKEIRRGCAEEKRLLILLSGVPGAGKTYVGLKIAHEPFLDDLAAPMESGDKPTAPAVFLSGNAPLVEVLQYELRRAGGGGRVFVRGVRDFVERYSREAAPAPPHHVLIFDEAQRAWDAEKVRSHHHRRDAVSEPTAFIEFAERIPSWSVVIGLIGEGQEIHTGEEAGIGQWAEAVRDRPNWEAIGPAQFRVSFIRDGVKYETASELHLATSVRFNFAAGLSDWAAGIVADDSPPGKLREIARDLVRAGYQLRITRDLAKAQQFLWAKYRDLPDSRFGLLVSSRDRDLGAYEIRQSRFFRAGPWYADPEASPNSCRRLLEAATEFAAQGLELDHVLLAWGGDFLRNGTKWDNGGAKRYRDTAVKDPLQLRRNAYRVLLTRGREGLLIWVPEGKPSFDKTFEFLRDSGCMAFP
ncbi:MAG: DNA/RNA helicase domain-containing protein [Opitutaceae bacterium]|jgi:DUF2075 family protein